MTGYLAIDFGGTRTRAAWFDDDLTLMHRDETLSEVHQSPAQVINRIIRTAQTVVPEDTQPAAIGISAPGPLDAEKGLILEADTLPGWKDVPLAAHISEAFNNRPAHMQNDANLAALAEYHFGAGKECNPLVYLTLSTGIGGGLVIDGRLFTGWQQFAIEPGHMRLLLADNTLWKLQDLASGTALGEWAERRLTSETRNTVLRQVNSLTGKAVGEAARDGDPVAREIVEQAGRWLGAGLVNLLHLFNPQAIVLGGSVAQLDDLLLKPARRVIQEEMMHSGFYHEELLRLAALGDDVCLHGAASYARTTYISGR